MKYFPLILNSNNLVPSTNNNTYRYNFPTGSVKFANTSIAVSNIAIFYSWINISAAENNNTYQILQPTLAGTTTLTITMPDGFYDVAALNAYLQYSLIQANFYLVDGSGNYIYYAQFQENSTLYSVEFDSFPVPTALPTGYTNPGAMTFPAVASTPRLVIAATNLQDNLGFNAGTYPTVVQATNYSKTSDYTPQLTSIQSIIVGCSLLRNIYASPNTVLYGFTSNGSSYGELISSAPNQLSFCSVCDGQYNSFDIVFYDQEFNQLPIKDTNLVITLILEVQETPALSATR